VKSHLNDPRWIYITRNVELRQQIMKSVFGQTIRWLSKNSSNIYVKYARRKNDNNPKEICAVAAFLEPNSRIKAPITTLVLGIGKIVMNSGTKIASRVKTMVQGMETFAAEPPPNCWELFYVCVDPKYIDDREYWEDIVWNVLKKADKQNELVRAMATDVARLDLLKDWGFGDIKQGWCIENKVQIWGTIRLPQKCDPLTEDSASESSSRSEIKSSRDKSSPRIGSRSLTDQIARLKKSKRDTKSHLDQ